MTTDQIREQVRKMYEKIYGHRPTEQQEQDFAKNELWPTLKHFESAK